MATYRPVDPKANFPALEAGVLDFWRRARIFEKSLALREGGPEWVFYEGPPTANGRPGIHHVEARTFKDLYPRYRTMTGHYVYRKAGWDCHGIPVEIEVEKEIGTRTKRDIEAYGVERFNQRCRESVRRYVDDWARLTERIGFWINLDEAYWTMDPEYIQSVWWALKELHGRGLLYRDDKVTAYCPRCGTPLSDHEVALGYATVRDPSVVVRFRLLEVPSGEPLAGASVLVWTTTPWTLISNLGLAVKPDEPYEVWEVGGDRVVLAAARKRSVLGEEGTRERAVPGRALVGARYEPLYPNVEGGAHRVVGADFVAMDEGTGVVHLAPAFGAEDLEVGRREGWPAFNPVDPEGRFTDLAPPFVRGRWVKDADGAIIEDLRGRGLLVRAEEYEHTYPLCWRCDTPLLYYARPAWYLRTTAFRDRLLEVNDRVNWYPEHIKHGRYGDWLANNVDWSLSRERYWGTPLPVWVCPGGHETAVGSLEELSALAGRDLTGMDPHRPYIDEVTLPCPQCGERATRVPYLIDVWFDAGAMPYAQWGYRGPGSPSEEVFRRRFPADFISEAIDQTRGWFYTLMAEAVLLFDDTAYRNVVCLGHIVDAEGRKMSKSLGNVIDPWAVIDTTGADALRWFLIASGSPWTSRRTSVEAVQDVVRQFLLTLWNTYAFFVTYANIDRPDLRAAPPPERRPPLDRWALSRLHSTAALVREAMDGYDATGAARRLAELVDDLSNWYVRRSRRRFWDPARAAGGGGGPGPDKLAAHATLHQCLVTVARLLAPFIPFVTEEIYRNLVAERDPEAPESVHLTDFPVADPALVDRDLEEAMEAARAVVSLGRQVRTRARVRVRQPLARAQVHVPGDPSRLAEVLPLVAEELNVRTVELAESAERLSEWRARPSFRTLGSRLGGQVQAVAAALAGDDGTLAAALASGSPVTLALEDGTEVTLTPGDVELTQRPRAGWEVASDGRITVALDLEVSEDLRVEGTVRDLIHHVQGLRRSAGLAVTDRIVLGVEAPPPLDEAIRARRDLVAGEVLAVEVLDGPVPGSTSAAELTLDGAQVRVSLRPA